MPDTEPVEKLPTLPKQEQVPGTRKLTPIFLRAIHYLPKFIPKLSESIEKLRQFSKKPPDGNGRKNKTKIFRKENKLSGNETGHSRNCQSNGADMLTYNDDQIMVPTELRKKLLDTSPFAHDMTAEEKSSVGRNMRKKLCCLHGIG